MTQAAKKADASNAHIPSGDRHLQSQLLKQLYDQAPSAIIAMPFCSILLVLGLKDAVDITALLAWMTTILVLTLTRSIVVYLYSVSPSKEEKYKTWLTSYILIEFFAGLIWCSTALLLPQLDIIHQMLVFFAYGGMLMGATVILAPLLMAFIAYSLPSTALFVIGLLRLDNEIYVSMAFLTSLFTVVLVYICLLMNRRIIHSIGLSRENIKLVQDIRSVNEQMSQKIIEKEHIEKKLLSSRNELSRVIEHMQDTYYRTDQNGRIVNVSPSVKNLLGYEPQELLGTEMANLYANPKQRDDFIAKLQSANGKLKNYEAKLIAKDENTIWVSTNAQFYHDKQGNVIGVEGTTRDITQNRVTSEAIIKSKEEFKSLYEFNFKILENSPIGIMTLNEGNAITYMNPALKGILGVPDDRDHIGKDIDIATLSSIQAANLGDVLVNLHKGESINLESEFTSLYGKYSVMDIRAIPLMEKNAYKGALVFAVNITEQAKERSNLFYAKNQAEFDSQTKEVFIERISEELKTPLTDILGMADLLINENKYPDIEPDLEIILNASKVILEYIQTISSVVTTKNIEETQRKETHLPTFLQTTIESFSQRASRTDMNFVVDIDDSIPENIKIDYRWFNGIIANILYDFIHNNPEGTIRLSIKYDKSQSIYIQIFHSDYYIPAKIFDSSIKNVTPSEYNVNLAISKQLVESLGGKTWVEGIDKTGSTVHIIIPTGGNVKSATQNETYSSTIEKQKLNLNILLVEDNKASQTVFMKMLENLGHHPLTATNGLEAVEAVEKEDFDLILMDINLPVMDGVEATKTIRQMTDPKKSDIPVIAITASSELNREQWLDAGINSYILKPASLSTLNEAINKLFSPHH